MSGLPAKQIYFELMHQDELLEFVTEISKIHVPFDEQAFTLFA